MQFAGDVYVAMRGCSGGFAVVVAEELTRGHTSTAVKSTAANASQCALRNVFPQPGGTRHGFPYTFSLCSFSFCMVSYTLTVQVTTSL